MQIPWRHLEKEGGEEIIRITNEIDGKKYELVKETHLCDGCAFLEEGNLSGCENYFEFNSRAICAKLHGIWKEVRDGGDPIDSIFEKEVTK